MEDGGGKLRGSNTSSSHWDPPCHHTICSPCALQASRALLVRVGVRRLVHQLPPDSAGLLQDLEHALRELQVLPVLARKLLERAVADLPGHFRRKALSDLLLQGLDLLLKQVAEGDGLRHELVAGVAVQNPHAHA
eukprot:UN1077